MLKEAENLVRFRELLYSLAVRELKLRYKQTLLGALWVMLQPLALMAVFTLVFSRYARMPTDGVPYPLFSFVSLLPWTFFASTLALGSASIVNNASLVTKVCFPREVFPIAALLAGLVDLAVGSVLVVPLLAYYGVGIGPRAALLVVVLPVLCVFTLGMSLFLAALYVKYRDVRFIIPLGLQIGMFATPVVYPLSVVPEALRPLYFLNPLAFVVESTRSILLHGGGMDFSRLGLAFTVSLAGLLGSFCYFKKTEKGFADVI